MMSRSPVSAGRWMCCCTRRTSRSPISWWPIATSWFCFSEAAEPPLTPTMTSRTCSPHISSAVDTADEMARVAASMSTMLPERMPWAGWWPMPTTRSPWPSTRATKQTTLLVPMSSAAITPFLVFATISPVATLILWVRRKSHGPGRRFARSALLEIELVRQPKIDHAELARQQIVPLVELGKLLKGGNRILLGQPDLDAIVQNQVPAPLADPHGGAQLARHDGLVSQQQQ